MKTVHCTTAQALVRFLDQQYVSLDGKESKFVEGVSVIFGHGIVLGLGEALLHDDHSLKAVSYTHLQRLGAGVLCGNLLRC